MKKTSTTIKNAIVLNFDGTLYWNPEEDFSMDICFHNIIDSESFFSEFFYQTRKNILSNPEIILVSGRLPHQKEAILSLLRQKGYNIAKSYFLPEISPSFQGDENSFLTHYWFWEVKILTQIRESKEYDSITVIYNDNIICSMLSELNFVVIKAYFDDCWLLPQVFFTPIHSERNLELIELNNR